MFNSVPKLLLQTIKALNFHFEANVGQIDICSRVTHNAVGIMLGAVYCMKQCTHCTVYIRYCMKPCSLLPCINLAYIALEMNVEDLNCLQ